jgi:Pyruvate/2-oxoacid:ferredoxin oxidoreductase delta subunit
MEDEVNALSLSCVDGGAIYEARRHAWATERVSMIADEMLDVAGYSCTIRCATSVFKLQQLPQVAYHYCVGCC